MNSENTTDLVTFVATLWSRKWILTSIIACFLIVGGLYAALAPEWYRATVVLVPVEENRAEGLAGQLGGLASLAGVNLDSNRAVESLAVLRSDDFAIEFIEEMGLLPVFWEELWDPVEREWQVSETEIPDIRDGVNYFREHIRRIDQEIKTGLVRLSVDWKDSELAAAWANSLVDRLNQRMRKRALQDALKNVEYLRGEMQETNIVAIQQSMGRLLESELQKLMLARGNDEFAFKVIDPAIAPKYPTRPKRLIILLGALLIGVIVGILVILYHARWQIHAAKGA